MSPPRSCPLSAPALSTPCRLQGADQGGRRNSCYKVRLPGKLTLGKKWPKGCCAGSPGQERWRRRVGGLGVCPGGRWTGLSIPGHPGSVGKPLLTGGDSYSCPPISPSLEDPSPIIWLGMHLPGAFPGSRKMKPHGLPAFRKWGW